MTRILSITKYTLAMASTQAAAGAPAAGACRADATRANLDFVLKDIDNRNVRLSDYRGKVILLNFWATWCVPCRTEIPWFVAFQETYGARGFQAIGVSADDTLDRLKPFVEDMEMTYPVLQGLGRNNLLDSYGVDALPVTMLISREGRVCATHRGITGQEVLANEIEALLSSARR